MLIVKHSFLDKYTGKDILAGTIVEVEDAERKKDLLARSLIAEVEPVVLGDKKNAGKGKKST